MRGLTVLTLLLLSAPAALWSEDHASYKDAFSWGQDKETFNITLTVRRAEGTFTVSEQGFRWIQLYTSDNATSPIPWLDMQRWSCQRGVLKIALSNRAGELNFKPDDLVKVVNKYFKKYAPEKLDPQQGCALEESR